MFDKFDYFNRGYIFGVKTDKYKPYINYTWQMLPNAKVKNSGTSGVDLQLYSGNPLDFQATQGIQVNKSFTLSGNAISLYLGFDTDSIAITHTLAEFDNLKVSIVNAILRVTINAVNHDVATIALNTYYQTEIVVNNNNLTVKLNGTQSYSSSCTALNTTMLKSVGANDGLASGRFDGQFDYFIAYNGLNTFSLPNQFFKDMSTNSNTLFATDFRGNSSNIKDYKSGMTYPITNYSATQRTNFTQVNKGLQELMIERDSLGFFLGLREFPKGNGVGYGDTGWIPSATEDFTIEITIDTTGNIWELCGNTYFMFGTSSTPNSLIFYKIFNGGYREIYGQPNISNVVFLYNSLAKTYSVYVNKVLKLSDIVTVSDTQDTNGFGLFGTIRNTDVVNKGTKEIPKFKVHKKLLTDEEIQEL